MTDDEILDECRKRFAVASDAKLGSVIRIRLPADYTISPGPGLVYDPMIDSWVSDSGDETKPIEEIYAAPEVKIESEAERTERLWLAIKEFSGG